ncbi:B12-binding domain-containing radical SAM protein [Oscillatoria laete-virens NRMC-F 0139]|nr:B12-binding domain-containing radical SAM protein [Oscillatoria laete-virens]MDL5052979.1 B12-binding domain-containing radical SAM protein [Oscillatoria laete-virens NRMC-F 0139]
MSFSFTPENRRKILCVFPKYSHSFGTFNYAFPLMGPVKAFMPPQGILLIASLLPKQWEVRFVDENVRRTTQEEFAWADAVFISGMHIQRGQILDINRRAQSLGKITALGGPSVSSAPEFYPNIDLLHCGEIGDATVELFAWLDSATERPQEQIVFKTVERLPMTEFPTPAYHHLNMRNYLLGSVQFSSGCPFTCEFCDIPGLYGRNPRLKSPEQIVKELDILADAGAPSVYFVDDNFIGNPKAAMELLPHLVKWQKERDYAVILSCEATLNLSQHTKILELMRDAYFANVFCGIETPESGALKAMKKTQNLRTPIQESIDILNSYGIEVASGIIMGMDTDTPETPQAIIDFIRHTNIPIATVNILYALPKTALHDRLIKAGRIVDDTNRDSNIDFLIPYEQLVREWKRVIAEIYDAEALYARYMCQVEKTFPNQAKKTQPLKHLTWSNLSRAFDIALRILWHVGIRAPYRKHFWKMAWSQIKVGNIENIFQIIDGRPPPHHLRSGLRQWQGAGIELLLPRRR